MKNWLLLFMLPVIVTTVFGQALEPAKILRESNEAYQGRNYKEAIEGYEALVAAGYRSEALFYNLGNSYYRTGELGRAMLNYERARLIDPDDEDILHNIAVLRREQQNELEVIPEFFLLRWWKNTRRLLDVSGWSVLGILLLWTGSGGLVLWLLGQKRTHRKWGFLAGIALIGLSFLPFSLAASRQAALHNSDIAVILEAEVALRSAPDPQSKPILTLHEGLSIQLLDQIGEWYKVRLSDGEQGWLPMSSLEKLTMSN
jgi:tetratricopeptide (TPR) repeat protein